MPGDHLLGSKKSMIVSRGIKWLGPWRPTLVSWKLVFASQEINGWGPRNQWPGSRKPIVPSTKQMDGDEYNNAWFPGIQWRGHRTTMVGVQEINSWVQASIGGGPGAMAASQEFNGSDAESQWVWAQETRGVGHRKNGWSPGKKAGPRNPMAGAQQSHG